MSIFSDGQDIVDLKRGNKYYAIARELKRRMDEGEIATRLPTLLDICQMFETTPVTAHKAIGLLKREGLVTAIKGKGTFVTRLKRPRVNVIEAIVHGMSRKAPLHQALIDGVQHACSAAGQRLVVTAHGGKAEQALALIHGAWDAEQVDGFIVWPPEADAQKNRRWIDCLKEQGIPFVLAPEANADLYPDCHTVNSDPLTVIETLVAHVVQKGHRRIGFAAIAGSKNHSHVTHRYAGYQHILGQKGLEISPPLGISVTQTDHALIPRLRRGRLQDYTAIVCATDFTASMICRLCLEQGIRVPGDLEVTGYDNNPESAILGFTSADQRFDEIGKRAARLLLDEIGNRLEAQVHEVIKGVPVFR